MKLSDVEFGAYLPFSSATSSVFHYLRCLNILASFTSRVFCKRPYRLAAAH